MMLKGSDAGYEMVVHTSRNLSKKTFLTSRALCKPVVKQAWRRGMLILQQLL